MNKIAAIFELLLCGIVRCNFIGLHKWNGWESTNQLRQHISLMEYVHVFLALSYWVEAGPKRLRNCSRKDHLTALESQTMTIKSFDVGEKVVRCLKSEVLSAFSAGFFCNGNFKHRKSYKMDSFVGQPFCLFDLQRPVTGRYLVIFAVRCWKFRGGRS